MSYFELFGIKPAVEIDQQQLQQKYFALQREFHPDKNAGNTAKSAELNDAYNTLKDRFRRLEYLVRDQTLEACAALLEEMLELREDPQAGIPKAEAEIEKLFGEAAGFYAKNEMNKLAQDFVRIKYLKKFLEDAKA